MFNVIILLVKNKLGKIVIFVDFKNVQENPLEIQQNAAFAPENHSCYILETLVIDDSKNIVNQAFFQQIINL